MCQTKCNDIQLDLGFVFVFYYEFLAIPDLVFLIDEIVFSKKNGLLWRLLVFFFMLVPFDCVVDPYLIVLCSS